MHVCLCIYAHIDVYIMVSLVFVRDLNRIIPHLELSNTLSMGDVSDILHIVETVKQKHKQKKQRRQQQQQQQQQQSQQQQSQQQQQQARSEPNSQLLRTLSQAYTLYKNHIPSLNINEILMYSKQHGMR